MKFFLVDANVITSMEICDNFHSRGTSLLVEKTYVEVLFVPPGLEG